MAMVLLAAIAVAGGSHYAQAQISLTKHYLGTKVVTPGGRNVSNAETCVFCHTPRGAEDTAVVPLWNRALAEPNTYTTYNSLGSSSLDGVSASVGSVSMVCLSCHDGVQSLNVAVNAPRFSLAGSSVGASGPTSRTADANYAPGSSGRNDDFKGEHPFGARYGGGALAPGGPPQAPSPYFSSLMRDSDFSDAQSSIVNGQSVWWIDTAAGAPGARDKTDIQLYTRIATPPPKTGGATAGGATAEQAGAPEPYIECASCHDPHSAANATFLRIANTGSAVCLACHGKM